MPSNNEIHAPQEFRLAYGRVLHTKRITARNQNSSFGSKLLAQHAMRPKTIAVAGEDNVACTNSVKRYSGNLKCVAREDIGDHTSAARYEANPTGRTQEFHRKLAEDIVDILHGRRTQEFLVGITLQLCWVGSTLPWQDSAIVSKT
ncbi:MAG TPA: hypothetical protein VMF66_17265 [Candidatus Acidoferrum sp.]|nr:hypothetical protein [Candidatus Acidoferrum sp.]